MLLTTHEAAAFVGITFRQLDYWERTGLIRSNWQGGLRRYDPAAIQHLQIAKALLDSGISLEAIRELRIPYFNERGDPRDYVLAVYNSTCEYVRMTDVFQFVRQAKRAVAVLPLTMLV